MSVYHTPRCRITWTNVHSAGADRDVVIADQPLTLFFGLTFDNNIRWAGAGLFILEFHLISPGGIAGGGYWTGPFGQLPGNTGDIWVSKTWNVATDAFRRYAGTFLYRPSATFRLGLTGDDEFAVAEEDHYIYLEY